MCPATTPCSVPALALQFRFLRLAAEGSLLGWHYTPPARKARSTRMYTLANLFNLLHAPGSFCHWQLELYVCLASQPWASSSQHIHVLHDVVPAPLLSVQQLQDQHRKMNLRLPAT